MKNIKYDILLDIDFNNFVFKGKEKIFFDTEKGEEVIYPNSVALDIKKVLLNGKEIDFYLKEGKIVLSENYKEGGNVLEIDFSGKLRDDLTGLYLSRYTDDNNKERYIATTHFEPVDARKAFPCFDKPDKKAKFKISLLIDKNFKAVSNTLPEKEEISDDKKLVVFKETPLMSTYLVYIGVGDFDFLEDEYRPALSSNRNVLLRVVGVNGKSKYGEKALYYCKKTLEYLENYFGIEYPLEKLDLLSIPDFSVGAMENWGAITFRENLLLFDKEKSSKVTEQRIAIVLSHELVHQWFGNLVTMKWWDDLWLNESFATFMAYKAIDSYKKEWNVFEDYLLYETFGGKDFDSKKTSHPIKVSIENESQIEGIFDEISYNKGGSVLRHIEEFIGEENFMMALRDYLNNFKYSNASASDLWQSFAKYNKDILEVIEDMVNKVGFPRIRYEVLQDENLNYKISQERFLKTGEKDENLYNVPLVVRLEDSEIHKLVMKSKEVETSFNKKPLYFNVNGAGFYLVDNFINKNDFEKLNSLEKLSYVDDIYLKTKSCELKVEDFINYLDELLNGESNSTVLYYYLYCLLGFWVFLDKKIIVESANKTAEKIVNILGFETREEDNFLHTTSRKLAVLWLGLLGDERAKEKAFNLFNKYIKGDKFDKDLLQAVFPIVLVQNPESYNLIFDRYLKSKLQEEKSILMQAFLFCKDINITNKILENAKNNNIIKLGMLPYLFNPLALKDENIKNKVLEWIFDNWDYYSKNVMITEKIFKLTIPLLGVSNYEKTIKFLEDKEKVPSFEKQMKEFKEEVEINMRFVKYNS
ncbi:Aminopeptidase N [bacterium HR34]|nr:Aminopeptidase N [bacterium HR34]